MKKDYSAPCPSDTGLTLTHLPSATPETAASTTGASSASGSGVARRNELGLPEGFVDSPPPSSKRSVDLSPAGAALTPRIYVFLMFLLCTSDCILERYFSCGVSNDRGCRDRVSKIEQTSKALILKTETYQRGG